MKLFEIANRIHSAPAIAWSLTMVICLMAILGRFAIDPILPPGFQYITFFPAVIVTSFFCGLRPGVLSCVVSVAAAWYWFIEPRYSFELTGPTTVAIVFFSAVAAIDVAIIHFARVTVNRLGRERADNRELYQQQKTMFQELQHRVANNMQFVASLLAVQKRKVAKDPSLAIAAFEEAQDRLATVARVHRRLYDPDTVQRPIGQYLEELANDVLQSGSTVPVKAEVSAPQIRFDLKELTTLSLLIIEALTNAQKHAFKHRQQGRITIELRTIGPGQHRLTVADDGIGFDAMKDPVSSNSLGQRIMQSLAAQLGGTISYGNHEGTQMTVEFFAPVHRPLAAYADH